MELVEREGLLFVMKRQLQMKKPPEKGGFLL
jgi:hypothetical protein